MHDIDRVLRERLGDMGATVPADSAQVLRGVSAVRRRRVALRAAACCVALLAGGSVGAAAVRGGTDVVPAVGSSSADFGDGTIVTIHAVTFGDVNHGYVLVQTSAEAQFPLGEMRLAVTEDGGRTWQSRALPAEVAGGAPSPSAGHGSLVDGDGRSYVLPGLAAIGASAVELYSTMHQRQWASNDGGRTWSQTQQPPEGDATSIPDGGLVHGWHALNGTGDEADPGRLRVLGPDGRSSFLHDVTVGEADVRFSTGSELAYEGVAASDGSYWLPCNKRLEPKVSQACIAVTRDKGHNWQIGFPKPPGEPGLDAFAEPGDLSTVDGQTVYFLNRAGDGDGRQIVTLLRSRDAGSTWATVPIPAFKPDGAEGQLISGVTGMRVLPNGDAFIVVDGQVYRMAAGTDQFKPVPGAPKDVDMVVWTGSKLIVARFPQRRPVADQDLVYISTNGTDWTRARLP